MRFAKTIAAASFALAASLLFSGTAFAAEAGLNIIPAPREINVSRLRARPKS